jgi:hypothetical protein
MYCDVQVINGLIDFADMRDHSLYEKKAHESANPVRSSEKRVLGKLSDPFDNYFPKKKTALSGLPKHAPYGFEKTQRLKSSVHPYHRTCVRRNLLHSVSGVCVSAPKTSYPQFPSSFPHRTHFVGLRWGPH